MENIPGIINTTFLSEVYINSIFLSNYSVEGEKNSNSQLNNLNNLNNIKILTLVINKLLIAIICTN